MSRKLPALPGKAAKSAKVWLTPRETAERLGITLRRVQQLAATEGLPKRGDARTARHPWPTVRAWYDSYREQAFLRKHRPTELSTARARKVAAEARLAEVQARRAEGDVVDVMDFDRAVGDAFQRVDRKLKAVPARLGPQVAPPDQVPVLVAKLRSMIEEIRDELRMAHDVPPHREQEGHDAA